eukprot:gnl/TRDRNA2_/TRDRNA2_44299_c0_seq1.p1 gnl/TRDRNA2_/TRDRNA2_44299_c0~~gnl/TRDRNA2_/TRDRNA2_44299_c0_seq1.p1  ORF type:complete len:311 (+),score=14.00 gnl/TRDRNA2_/TRDRNA2_44299_c0_seq1:98-1030(+)
MGRNMTEDLRDASSLMTGAASRNRSLSCSSRRSGSCSSRTSNNLSTWWNTTADFEQMIMTPQVASDGSRSAWARGACYGGSDPWSDPRCTRMPRVPPLDLTKARRHQLGQSTLSLCQPGKPIVSVFQPSAAVTRQCEPDLQMQSHTASCQFLIPTRSDGQCEEPTSADCISRQVPSGPSFQIGRPAGYGVGPIQPARVPYHSTESRTKDMIFDEAVVDEDPFTGRVANESSPRRHRHSRPPHAEAYGYGRDGGRLSNTYEGEREERRASNACSMDFCDELLGDDEPSPRRVKPSRMDQAQHGMWSREKGY